MSDKITITIDSEELEKINIELTSEEVLALYKLRKEQSATIEKLQKDLSTMESQKNNYYESYQKCSKEIEEASTLLTALGIPEKTEHTESYYQKSLSIVARIGYYLATKCK